MAEIEIYPDVDRLALAAAEKFAELAQAAIAAQGYFAVAVSGGVTPKILFALLADEHWAESIDWARVLVFWVDERCVLPDHADSNYRLAETTWLRHVPIPAANIHRMIGEIDPIQAAEQYETTLRAAFPEMAVPSFDLILLGLGEDGHTASWFPGTAIIKEYDRWVSAQYVDKLSAWRITLTPVIINAARQVIFLVTGTNKAERLKEVLEGPYDPQRLPAQVIQPEHCEAIWLVDAEAGALLM